MGLAVGEAGLPQVLGVGADHRDLLPGHTRPQDEFVESVDLRSAVPDGGDGIGEPLRGGIPVLLSGELRGGLLGANLELVDPDLQPVAAIDREGALLEHLDSHALQHGQQLAERRRAIAQIPGEEYLPPGVAGLKLEDHRILGHRLDQTDVVERLVRGDRLLELLGQRVRVVLQNVSVDPSVLTGTQKPVGPGPGCRREQILHPDPVFLRGVDCRTIRRVGQSNGEMYDCPE